MSRSNRSREIRKFKISLLHSVLARLERRRSPDRYICTAICKALKDQSRARKRQLGYTNKYAFLPSDDPLQVAARKLREYVMNGITGKHFYYHDWLEEKCPAYRALTNFEERKQAAHAGRIAWVKHMIAQLEGTV